MDPDLSIVIVNWNGGDMLPACLDGIRHWRGNLLIEIIVFDNGSTDNSREQVEAWSKELPIRLLTSDVNLGFARANNLAWAATRAEVGLLLNNDAVIGGPHEDA